MASHQPSMDSLFKERDFSSSRRLTESDDAKSTTIECPTVPSADVEKQLQTRTASDTIGKPDAPSADPNLVGWDGKDDPENPLHWPIGRKLWATFLVSLMCFCVTTCSSIWSEAVAPAAEEFHTSREVMFLGIALFVLGFACGPLIFGPMSEWIGRSRPLLCGFLCFTIFQIPVAVAQNLETIFICRFLAAAFGTSTFAIGPGILVDMWEPSVRGIATLCWQLAVLSGSTIGPIIGAYTVVNPHLGWRWTAWLMLIIAVPTFVLFMLTTRESFPPVLLQRKAARLRRATRNWALHSKRDEDPVTIRYLAREYGVKPLRMLTQEPILAAITAFMSLVYAIIYLLFVAYPYAFQEVRGWDAGTASLPFISVLIGYALACVICIFESRYCFQRLLHKNNGHFEPEHRLPPLIAGSFVVIIGLFWFAWTSSPSIQWAPQAISGVFIGCGIFLVYVPGQVYIMDVYPTDAASAMAGNAATRAVFACALPLAGEYMYKSMGVDWGMSLLGFLCVGLVPFPILFYYFGPQIRKRSRFATG